MSFLLSLSPKSSIKYSQIFSLLLNTDLFKSLNMEETLNLEKKTQRKHRVSCSSPRIRLAGPCRLTLSSYFYETFYIVFPVAWASFLSLWPGNITETQEKLFWIKSVQISIKHHLSINLPLGMTCNVILTILLNIKYNKFWITSS